MVPHLLKLNQHLITCAPTILLHYLARYFDDIISVTLPQVRQVVEKRSRIAKMLDALKLKRLGGSSTFYFFISIEDFPGSSMDLALSLLVERGVAVVPGSAYGQSTSRFIRVSIGTEPEERVWRALLMIRDLICAKEFNRTQLQKRLDGGGIPTFRR